MTDYEDRSRKSPPRSEARFAPFRDLSYVYEGHGKSNHLRVADLSPNGMFLNIPQTYAEGAVLSVEFRLPNSAELIKVRAEVRYCLPGVGVGVEFVEILPEHRKAIREQMLVARGLAVPDVD